MKKNKKKRLAQKAQIVSTLPASKSAKTASLLPEVIPSVVEGGSAFQNYMARISRIPVLSRAEEHELAVAYYETKDPEIARKLIQSNLRFVVKVAAEYSKFSSKIMDLIQEGNIGLMRSLKEFNPYKGARLITYAVWWIRGYIQEYLMRHHSIVRLGTNKKQQRLFYLLQKEKQNLEDYSQKRLLPGLAQETKTKLGEVEKMKEIVLKKDFSLDQPINSEKGAKSFLELQQDDSSIDENLSLYQMSELLKKHLKALEPELSEKEKSIIKNRLLKDPAQTLQQIADEFNVTREAVRQSEERLMKKLKEQLAPLLKKPY